MVQVVNMVFAGAMGIPGGGRTLPTKRLLRHFNLLHVPVFSGDSLYRIFSKIMEWAFKTHPFTSWKQCIPIMTDMTIKIYEKVVKKLLPLPSKSHYLFNLR